MPSSILTLTPNPALDVWTTTARFRVGPKLRCTAPKIDPGGGGVNVSRVVHRLGGDTTAIHAAGGRTGEELAACLDREGVPAERCAIEGATREDFSVCATETGDVLRFVTPGPALRAREIGDLLDRLRDHAATASLVVGSGSLPDGTGDDFWAKAAMLCEDAGARFVLDSHDRVGPALEAGVFCFRENTDAIAGIAGRDVGWPEDAADWAEDRVRSGAAEMIVITEGAQGALLVQRDLRLVLSPPLVEVRSAIGAGDSFVAGLCLALARGEGPDAALRLAVATAAATLLTPGTELCRKDDVDRLVAESNQVRRI